MKEFLRNALVAGLLALPALAGAQRTTSEPAPRSTLLGIALPYEPRRITGGSGYTSEAASMSKGALSYELGKCTGYELLYWTTGLKVKPAEAYSRFLAATRAAGWSYKEVFKFNPLEAFVLSKGGRRVLGSLVLDNQTLSLCELKDFVN